MMLQNYTYVDPFTDPVVLLTLMLGLVFLAAAMVVFSTIRSIATPEARRPEMTADFVPSHANRITLASSLRHAWPDREARSPERRDRVAENGSAYLHEFHRRADPVRDTVTEDAPV